MSTLFLNEESKVYKEIIIKTNDWLADLIKDINVVIESKTCGNL
jgi:hypothetical protein